MIKIIKILYSTFIGRFGVFTETEIQVVVFWFVTPYSHEVGYQQRCNAEDHDLKSHSLVRQK
jgi:hypothetical protein